MTINKMTLACALSIGLLASNVSINAAVLDDISGLTLAACPLSGCPKRISPKTAKCPKCFMPQDQCKCKQSCDPLPCAPCESEVSPCEPCGAAPCAPCDPCEKPKCDPCEKKQCDPCEKSKSNCDCAPLSQCEEPAIPSCATCPYPSMNTQRQQIYAYPFAVYGGNNVIGEYNNGIGINQDPFMPCQKSNCSNALSSLTDGILVSRPGCDPCQVAPSCNNCKTPCLNDHGYTTGAACDIPTLQPSCGCGVPVQESISGCPIKIETKTSMDLCKKTMKPFNLAEQTTGCAAPAPILSSFTDVPAGFWAGCDINRLAENDVVVGYPDRTFKPNLPVSRAELASMVIKGFNLNDRMSCPQNHFKDVPKSHWANKVINKAVADDLMCGYPNGMFKPNQTVSRAEALTILSKGIKCDLSECQAQEILSQYCDGSNVPCWAQVPVAKALQAGVLNDSPRPKSIMPNDDASRADIASMLQSVRIAMGYDSDDKVSMDGCDTCNQGQTYIETQQIVKVPTLKLCFKDEISAKHANIGDRFAAKTIDEVTINGVCYPAGSTVHGTVTEVIRPTMKCRGALKLSFNDIQNGKCKTKLPNQVNVAQVNSLKRPNFFARLVEAPFNWTGSIIGTASRTVGGALVNAGNAVESVFNGVGVGTGEIFQGQLGAAGRSYGDAIKNTLKAPIDLTRTALSGTMGLFATTGDEIAYLVDANGNKVSSVNPKEQITISFGCDER